MARENSVTHISFAMISRDDPEVVEIGLYDEAGHFRLKLTRPQASELGLKAMAAATNGTTDLGAALVLEGFEAASLPDGLILLTLGALSGEKLRTVLPRNGALAMIQALQDAMKSSPSLFPGGGSVN